MFFTNLLRHIILVGLVSALPAAALAQGSTAPSPNPPAARTVKMSLIVTDQSNHSVGDIKKEDLQLLEDKVPQTLTLFEKDSRPVKYVVAIDTSGSFKDLLEPVIEASKMLVNQNRDLDETMLMRFISSGKIEKVEDFTSDKSKLFRGLDGLYVEQGQTAVVDAMYVAVQTAAEYKAGDTSLRRAVVMFSDGEERASYYKVEQLVKLLRSTDVQLFLIGITVHLDRASYMRPGQKEKAEKLLKKIAGESGGRVFFPTKPSELAEALNETTKDLRGQYLIGFEPNNTGGQDKFRKIEVKVIDAPDKKHIAISRPGYFLYPPAIEVPKKKSN
ncbi:MAG TPA: VWA domain-containing protein [Pyrinomonadaceae bacterium]|nr:VWA domain-containing protein [Pyrinomonadaceae bacterium]